MPSTLLERGEAAALIATKKVLAQCEGSPFFDEVSRALDKMRQYLPEAPAPNEFLNIYSFEKASPPAFDPRFFAIIEDAIRSTLKITITYRASWNQGVTERTVHPYIFHYSQQSDTWYLIGYCELRGDFRTFAINRIRTLTLTKKHFTVQKAFSVDTYIAETFDQIHDTQTSNVAIRFSPFQSQWIREHQWHPSQKIEEFKDGSLILKMQVGALDAVKRWVMRYGSEAEVLEPQELREMIKHELLATDKLYEDVRVQMVESLSLH